MCRGAQTAEKPSPQRKWVKGKALVGCIGIALARRRPYVATHSALAPRVPKAQWGAAYGLNPVCQRFERPYHYVGALSICLNGEAGANSPGQVPSAKSLARFRSAGNSLPAISLSARMLPASCSFRPSTGLRRTRPQNRPRTQPNPPRF
mgnify:CR=1 FL=1